MIIVSDSKIFLFFIFLFFLDNIFRGLFLFTGALLGSEVIVEALSTLLKVLITFLVIVLASISKEDFDALVEPVEVSLAFISEV